MWSSIIAEFVRSASGNEPDRAAHRLEKLSGDLIRRHLFWVEGNNYKDAIPRALLQMEEHLLPSFLDEPGDDEPK